ncbi:Uncharacterized protein GBIM_07870 [Gryllus bimaculatus]|nr:Uncharacterized protein GBIM_07870 [Gryllus bimaculatus]
MGRAVDAAVAEAGYLHVPSSQSRRFPPLPRGARDRVPNWGLQIKFVQPRDAGMYECQVSMHPPTSIFIELKVTEAEAEILGAPDLHLKSGSQLRLVCSLRHSTEAPVYVFWYHEDRMINYDKERGVTVTHNRSGSVLKVPRAEQQDSGNYTCVPSNARAASVTVHVLNGIKIWREARGDATRQPQRGVGVGTAVSGGAAGRRDAASPPAAAPATGAGRRDAGVSQVMRQATTPPSAPRPDAAATAPRPQDGRRLLPPAVKLPLGRWTPALPFRRCLREPRR